MKIAPALQKTNIDPETLIGTKWIGWGDMDCLKVEFVDETNCIYTSLFRIFPLNYAVREGKVFLSYIDKPFELRGNILFNAGFPAFERAA